MKMKILVTGATGLIGTAVVNALLKKGYSIHYLTTSKDKMVNEDKYKGFYWNPKNNEIDTNCFEGIQVIIHLAGSSISKRWTTDYKKEILESRVHTTEFLFESLKKCKITLNHFIAASGTAIYPENFDNPHQEATTVIEKSFLANVVVKWEKSIHLLKSVSENVTILRTGVVLDKNGGAFPEMIKSIKFGFGAVISNGNQYMSWIHLDDIVGIYVFVLENKLDGVYNAVAPNPLTNRDFTKKVALKLNKLLWLPNVPSFMIKLLLGEMSYLVLNSKYISSDKIIKSGYSFDYPNIDYVLNDFFP
jgi:uncharacterized protein